MVCTWKANQNAGEEHFFLFQPCFKGLVTTVNKSAVRILLPECFDKFISGDEEA